MKPDFSKYSKASAEVRAVFRDYDPDLDAASLDEAYMDVTDYCRAHEKSGDFIVRFVVSLSSYNISIVCLDSLYSGTF